MPERERTAPIDRRDRFRGLLLGTAVGDAIGYPAEGLSRARVRKLCKGRWRHRFLFGYGMVSDDTDHSVFVAQALLMHPDDVASFARRLARGLRWWLLGLPVGIGRATLYSIVRLWFGVPPPRSGIFSAGNGAAMRAAMIGAFFAEDRVRMDAYLKAQTRITHSDPKALAGSRAVAYLAAWTVRDGLARRPSADDFHETLCAAAPDDDEWTGIADRLRDAARDDVSVERLADTLGLSKGVSGYVYHTVPVAAYAWLRHFGDFEAGLQAVLDCGGDTDTAGAIAGALAGTVTGESGIPGDWIAGLADWPRGAGCLRRIADRACESSLHREPRPPVRYFWPGMLPRNLLAFALTLVHLLRRTAPPY